MSDHTSLFRQKAPRIMRDLMRDFGLDAQSAAAILGNIGHECAGFQMLQELAPTVQGSRGGWGWCQWTGARRVAMESYCTRNGLNPSSDAANYAWLFCELNGSEKAAIPAVKQPGSLEEKVARFESAFERAGVKHYESRYRWARIALEALHGAPQKPSEPPVLVPPGSPPIRPDKPAGGLLALILAIFNALARIFKGK